MLSMYICVLLTIVKPGEQDMVPPLSISGICTRGQLKVFPLAHTLYRADPCPCQYLSLPVQRHRTPLTLLLPHDLPTSCPHLSCLRRRRNPIRNLWFHLRYHPQQLFNNLIPRLAARLFDFLQLLFRLFISVSFGFLVAACMLPKPNVSIHALTYSCVILRKWEHRTFFSKSLNSSSFFFRYSSISFWASLLASLTLLERSGRDG